MKYTFKEIAFNSTEKRIPVEEDRFTYIGLEHMDSRKLSITRFGSDVPLKGEKLVMRKGDILFGKRNTYLKRVAIAPFDGLFSAHGMVLRPNENVISKEFFPFFLSSDYFLDEAIRISVGSLSPTVNWKDLKDLEFEIPDFDRQHKIAELLSAANNLKESYEAMITATDEMVKSQFIEMFVNRGLPIRHLPDISENLDSRRIPITSGSRVHGPYPYYGASGIVDYVEDFIFDEELLLISEDGANLKDRVTPIAFVAQGKYWVNNHAHILRFKCKEMQTYVEHLINYLNVEVYLTGMAQPKLNQEQLNSIPIPIPNEDRLDSFYLVVRHADKSKFELKKAIEKIDKVMRALMQ